MTTDRDMQRQVRLRKTGAALVMAAGAILVALSVAGVLIAAGVIEPDYDYGDYPWPVYAVLAIASAALFWKGLQDWRKH